MADPIEARHRQTMNDLAHVLDEMFNGEPPPPPEVWARQTGFFLAVFDFNSNGEEGRFNYISNADRLDVKVLLREMLARFEGQPEIRGQA